MAWSVPPKKERLGLDKLGVNVSLETLSWSSWGERI